MEQIIPILIAVVVFAFQAYANYQKEQEKARKRKYGQPIPDDTIPVEVPREQAAKQVKRTAETRQRPRQPEYIPLEIPKNPYQQYQGMIEPDKAKRTRHAEKVMHHDLAKKVELTDLDGDSGGQANAWHHEFDLREAVINSIILERPAY
jgi:hypothetical protein